ncbi:MAG: hypothetical protein LIP77_11360 [Planctomycetes bacterium]|nr:hypothetical protein [Planctomycetota bacterium]
MRRILVCTLIAFLAGLGLRAEDTAPHAVPPEAVEVSADGTTATSRPARRRIWRRRQAAVSETAGATGSHPAGRTDGDYGPIEGDDETAGGGKQPEEIASGDDSDASRDSGGNGAAGEPFAQHDAAPGDGEPPAERAAAEIPPSPPDPDAIEIYRAQLAERLLERHNNAPAYGGQVARVVVVLARPPEYSLDRTMIRAEFDQLVYDHWGKRIPALESEYFVVTFGLGGVYQVQSDPSIRVGLDIEKSYAEHAPPAGDPFRHAGVSDEFRTPPATMPEWWRPDLSGRE